MYGSRCESVGILWYNWTVILPPASSHKSSDGTVIIFKWRYYKQTHSQMYAINKPFLLTFFFIPFDFLTSALFWKNTSPLNTSLPFFSKRGRLALSGCCSVRALYCVSGSQWVPLPDQLLWFADHVVPVFQLSAPCIHERPNDHNPQRHWH